MRVTPPAIPVRPRCYNPPAPRPGNWYGVPSRPGQKRRLRWYPNPFPDQCATWLGRGIGSTEETTFYPVAHGFDCRGCRLNPNEGEK